MNLVCFGIFQQAVLILFCSIYHHSPQLCVARDQGLPCRLCLRQLSTRWPRANTSPGAASLLPAVIITLPNITGFDFSTIHDVQIRVGTALPSSTKVVVDPSTINTLCADVVGPLGSTPGEVVRVACSGGAKSGKVVTVQIRSRTGETDVLQLAEVKVEGTLPT